MNCGTKNKLKLDDVFYLFDVATGKEALGVNVRSESKDKLGEAYGHGLRLRIFKNGTYDLYDTSCSSPQKLKIKNESEFISKLIEITLTVFIESAYK